MTTGLLSLTVAAVNDKGTKFVLPRIPCQIARDVFMNTGFSSLRFPICIFLALLKTKHMGNYLDGNSARSN